MILKNLFRRKGRTILTLLGTSIGVAAIIALGAMAGGLREGFSAMTQGSQADLVLSQSSAMSSLISSVEEAVADEVRALPEVDAALYRAVDDALPPGLPLRAEPTRRGGRRTDRPREGTRSTAEPSCEGRCSRVRRWSRGRCGPRRRAGIGPGRPSRGPVRPGPARAACPGSNPLLGFVAR